MGHAACRDHDPDLFTIEQGDDPAKTVKAKIICRTCPVRGECLEWGLRQTADKWSILGGRTGRERAAIRSRMRRSREQAEQGGAFPAARLEGGLVRQEAGRDRRGENGGGRNGNGRPGQSKGMQPVPGRRGEAEEAGA